MTDTEEPEFEATPEAIGWCATLLLGIPPPYGYCPTPARVVSLLSRNEHLPDPADPPPPDPASLPDVASTGECCQILDIGLSTFKIRVEALQLIPLARRRKGHLWSREQMMAVATWRPAPKPV